ncbi:MAG TPA: carbohydrate ABC transporter permease [Candidatus Eisenbergiella stercoravium]|nr:carbohydrate ABC transporter permease [Candidatus Eisenbergiella stercoravium]
MRQKKTDFVDIILGIIMVIITIAAVYPLYYIYINSLSGGAYVGANEVILYPKGVTTYAYSLALQNSSIVRSFVNSVFYTVAGTLLSVILSAFCAYPLSRKEFYGRKIFTAIIMFTMFFNGGIIPLFLTITDLHLYNTIWAILLPSCISVYNVIVMRTFFQSISYELTESAYIDGANDWVVFGKIILPLSKPILATMILFYGVANWNSFYNALMFLNEKALYPLQLVLRTIVIEGSTTEMAYMASSEGSLSVPIDTKSIKYAVVAVTTLPMIIVYPFVFKYFEKGVMIGSVKG